MTLKDKNAIVTGGSRGIGKAIALKLANLGADIAVNYYSDNEEAEANEVVNEITQLGRKAIAVQADVSDFSQVTDMIDKIKSEFGHIDILINNAGITKDNLIIKMKEEDWDQVISTNLKSVFNCTKAVSKLMVKQKYGKIISIASVVGVIGNAGQGNYAASKAGIVGFSKSIARELGSRGITVNVIAPGYIRTKMTDQLSDNNKEQLINQIPMKKLGEVEDIANLAGFLASDEASYITGQVININGGMAMV